MTNQHKSTTHEELYFHIREPHVDKKGKKYKAATVFARQEPNGDWGISIARCSDTDNFSREVGRNVARRRYFHDSCIVSLDKPTYEEAQKIYTAI